MNATKYSPQGGAICLQLDRHVQHIILRGIDSGMGIAPEDLPRIFEPFWRAESVGQIRGLGLSIAKAGVERHHGHIQVASTPGQGTTVPVFLPDA
ncbi:MAG: sensor histidine kinase [Anaerolineae bacterium]|nr:sensor histidine kinase [Anaerolineae bacterium]